MFVEYTKSIPPPWSRSCNDACSHPPRQAYLRSAAASTEVSRPWCAGDAQMANQHIQQTGTFPLRFRIERICRPSDRTVPDHKQHACLGLIEVNTHCNLTARDSSAFCRLLSQLRRHHRGRSANGCSTRSLPPRVKPGSGSPVGETRPSTNNLPEPVDAARRPTLRPSSSTLTHPAGHRRELSIQFSLPATVPATLQYLPAKFDGLTR